MLPDPDSAQVLVALLVRDLDGVSEALSELAVHLKIQNNS